MSWFKVDDAFHSSKPVLRIPRRYRAQAVGLWTLAGTWCAQEESDGFIPEYVIEELCGTPAMCKHLVQAGLWTAATELDPTSTGVRDDLEGSSSESRVAGWQFKNWAKYQPTRAQLEEDREKARLRQRRHRESQRDNGVTTPDVTESQPRDSGTPDPTRPDPTNTEAKASVPRKRGTRIPDDFHVTPAMVTYAREKCPNVDGALETEKFINYWRAKSGKDATKLDWVATWKNWMLRAQESAPAGQPVVNRSEARLNQNLTQLQQWSAQRQAHQPHLELVQGSERAISEL